MGELRRPLAVDLFAGAGGLSLGLEQAGFDIGAAVEIDPIHAAIHELNFPHTKVICRDIQKLSGDELRSLAGIGRRTIDVLAGGPPCQGFSLMGHRILEDPRNNLVFHFVRLVKELNPRVFLMENVPGMATGAHHQLLDEILVGFAEAGFRVRTPVQILSATEYGVPQERRRLFILGSRRDTRLPEYPAPRTAPPNMLPLNGRPHCPNVEEAIGDLPDIEQYDELLETDVLSIRLTGGSEYARRLRGELTDPIDYSYRRERAPNLLTGCIRARHTPLSRRRFARTVPGETEPISRFFKLSAGGVSNTLRAGTNRDRGAFTSPRPIHYRHSRCISIREASRLHSYPDWFRFHRTIWHGFRQIGNSVPPLLGRAVGSCLIAALGKKPSRPSAVLVPGPEYLAGLNMRAAARHFDVSETVIARRVKGTDPFSIIVGVNA